MIIIELYPRIMKCCCFGFNLLRFVRGGSMLNFGETKSGPKISKLYSLLDDLHPMVADVVLGTGGECFKGIGALYVTLFLACR